MIHSPLRNTTGRHVTSWVHCLNHVFHQFPSPTHLTSWRCTGLEIISTKTCFSAFLRSIVFMGCRKTSWVLNMKWMWLMSFLYGSKVMCFFWHMCFANYFWGRKSQQKCQSCIITNPTPKTRQEATCIQGGKGFHIPTNTWFMSKRTVDFPYSFLRSGFWPYFSCRKKMSTKFKHWLKQQSMSHPSRKNET